MKKLLYVTFFMFTYWSLAQQTEPFSISGVEVERNVHKQNPDTDNSRYSFTLTNLQRGLSTPDPSPEAVALYRYILDMYGKKTLTGQMWVQWGIHEINYVVEKTGKKPAIAGFDYINESQNAVENQRAIAWWNSGGIVTMMWHWGAPGVGEGYENSKATIDIDLCFVEGTDEYNDFWADLDRIADWLEKLKEANVPVIWRPFHELTGNWFWWSKEGGEKFQMLWKTMYDYLVHERGLNNLIWTLCYTASPRETYFPGAEYVDIAGADIYYDPPNDQTTNSHLWMFNAVNNAVGGNSYPVCFHECGPPPNPEECIADGAMWSWWMIWHTDWLTGVEDDYLDSIYNNDLTVTFDELPDIMEVYSWDATCEPSTITALYQIDGGDWQAGNKIPVGSGSVIKFNVESSDAGSWTWSGYSTSNNPDLSETEQTVDMNGLGTATVVFTNECGAVTTQTFHIIKGEEVPPLSLTNLEDRPLIVYPSIVTEFMTLRLSDKISIEEQVTVRIFDQQGRLVAMNTISETESSFDLSLLQSGIYSILVFRKGQILPARVVKK